MIVTPGDEVDSITFHDGSKTLNATVLSTDSVGVEVARKSRKKGHTVVLYIPWTAIAHMKKEVQTDG